MKSKKSQVPGKNDDSLYNMHDKGYKYLLSSKKVFMELLRSFIKQGWVEMIDESSVICIDKSYILQDFSGKEADLVYRVKVKDKEVIFYILMELQSTVDFQMPYRLLLYMIEIWRDILKNMKKGEAERKVFRLPVVVPVVLYNGEGKWSACRRYRETLDGYELFRDYVPDFKYILVDVNRISKKRLLELSNLIGSVFLLDQKTDIHELQRRIKELLGVSRKLTQEQFQMLKTWMVNILVRGLPEGIKEDVTRLIESSEEAESMVYNMEKTLKEAIMESEIKGRQEGKQEGILEGRQKGRQEGRQEGILETAKNFIKQGVSLDIIAKATGLSKGELAQLS